MKTFLIIIAVVAVVGAVIWIGTKYFGLFADADKDGIPDEVEDTVKEVKRRAKRVKEELSDIGDAAKDLANQVGDVGAAVKGKPRAGRKKKSAKK